MKTFTVRLNIPTVMWTLVEVEAKSSDEAAEKALALNADGQLDYETAGFSNEFAEVIEVEESEADNEN